MQLTHQLFLFFFLNPNTNIKNFYLEAAHYDVSQKCPEPPSPTCQPEIRNWPTLTLALEDKI